MWLIPLGRIIGFRAMRDTDETGTGGILYACAYVEGLDFSHGMLCAPIPQMFQHDDNDMMALSRWVAGILARPPGATHG